MIGGFNWHHQGIELANHGHFVAAEVCFRKAHPEPEALYNLANCLRRMCRYEEAEEIARRSLAIHPGAQETTALIGCLRLDQGDAEGACELLAKTTHLGGFNRFCYSLALLHAGRFEEGFREYDGRLTANNMPLPMWNGEDLTGKTLCITAEQGFGDTIMYSRFVQDLPFKHFFLTPNALIRLIPNALSSNIEFSADYMVPLMSLPARLGLKELPPWKPYICPPVRYSIPRAPDTTLAVGVVWRSKAGGLMRKPEEIRHGEQKSVPLELILPLATIPGIKLFSLQQDGNEDMGRLGAGPVMDNLGFRMMDFADLAGFMTASAGEGRGGGLDVILTVDTAPAHLAGAMGMPTIVMLNKAGSWQYGSGDTSPWYPYPDFRLVRQTQAGNWKPVIDKVRETLTEMAQR